VHYLCTSSSCPQTRDQRCSELHYSTLRSRASAYACNTAGYVNHDAIRYGGVEAWLAADGYETPDRSVTWHRQWQCSSTTPTCRHNQLVVEFTPRKCIQDCAVDALPSGYHHQRRRQACSAQTPASMMKLSIKPHVRFWCALVLLASSVSHAHGVPSAQFPSLLRPYSTAEAVISSLELPPDASGVRLAGAQPIIPSVQQGQCCSRMICAGDAVLRNPYPSCAWLSTDITWRCTCS
jgi:hypothetical protein